MTAFLTRNRWWITRALVLPLHIAVFATVAFFLVRLVPGDPVLARMDTSAGFSQEDYDSAAASMGLGGSLWDQLVRFWQQLLGFDLGTSPITGRPVWTEIMTRLPSTIELVTLGLLGAVLLALTLALVMMLTSNRHLHAALRFYGRLAGSVPDFAVAILGLVLFYTFLRIVPAPIGRVDPGATLPVITGFPLIDTVISGDGAGFVSLWAHYALPLAVIVLVHTPSLWKQLGLGVEEQVSAPSTLFKIASGATRFSVYRSILRRASASSVVMLGAMFGGLIGGVVVIEQLFGFGGVGTFAITSVETLDFLGLQGFLVVIAALCLIVFFLVDIANMLLDPRRRPGARVDG
ncbi:peptide/nickel transport system permease protein [Rathayibacter oskolensis]|uniref:Peptide/nickel transport system permease protein n=1 Tax=Rathayibacter oskolensis TaxID=1891671 RepID=A0A1X7PFG3_9MICO|nr:ABC transporter permease [Rathayibacter oskolensis]SMH49509.1 peptide/nickel transport system permease protein [Rathayibacter oskolensis]